MVKIVQISAVEDDDPGVITVGGPADPTITWVFTKFIKPHSSLDKVEMLTHDSPYVRKGAEKHGTPVA